MTRAPGSKFIDSPRNPVIKAAAALKARHARRQRGETLIDGLREVTRAAQAGVTFVSVFARVNDHGRAREKLEAALPAARVPWYALSDRAFDKVAFGQRHEIVAVVKTPRRLLEEVTFRAEHPCVAVLEAFEKPGNLGAVLRSADGAGIDAVIAVDGQTDLFNPNAIRASLGTIFSLQLVETTFASFATWSAEHGLVNILARGDAQTCHTTVDYRAPCAIVLGSEAHGLTERWNRLPHQAVSIPMLGVADSLNVSAAAAVLFYEARRWKWTEG